MSGPIIPNSCYMGFELRCHRDQGVPAQRIHLRHHHDVPSGNRVWKSPNSSFANVIASVVKKGSMGSIVKVNSLVEGSSIVERRWDVEVRPNMSVGGLERSPCVDVCESEWGTSWSSSRAAHSFSFRTRFEPAGGLSAGHQDINKRKISV